MSTSFELPSPDDFLPAAVGPPGERVFYVQAREGDQVVTLRLEKAQVSALAEHISGMLRDLPPTTAEQSATELTEPVIAEWVVGSMGVAYDEERDRIILVAEELVDEDNPDPDSGSARIALSRELAVGFVERAREVVSAGRPLCQVCGLPKDPEGHICPRSNGHRRDEA